MTRSLWTWRLPNYSCSESTSKSCQHERKPSLQNLSHTQPKNSQKDRTYGIESSSRTDKLASPYSTATNLQTRCFSPRHTHRFVRSSSCSSSKKLISKVTQFPYKSWRFDSIPSKAALTGSEQSVHPLKADSSFQQETQMFLAGQRPCSLVTLIISLALHTHNKRSISGPWFHNKEEKAEPKSRFSSRPDIRTYT